MAARERPLSPHLQVYKPLYTMVLSILHRATGIALSVGSLLLAWWLVAAASGAEAYALVATCLGSLPGQLLLVGFSFAFFYHLSAGLRHLAWDLGYGFEKRTARRSGALVVVSAVVLTTLLWCLLLGGAA
jgi:succinate dehydrogenase / fumarate reductase cytochrome b subunit